MSTKSSMNQLIAYTLIAVYALILLKPILPVANDFIGHIFFKNEHIANVHHKNGENHLHHDLHKAHLSSESASKNDIKTEIDISAHLLSDFTIQFYRFTSNFGFGTLCFFSIQKAYKILAPPPDCFVI